MRRARTLRAVGVAAITVALTSCVKLDMEFEVRSDETIDGTVIFAISEDVMDMAEMMGEDPDSLIDEIDPGELPEGADVKDYDQDGFVGQQYTFEGASIDEFDGVDDEQLSIVHDGDEYVVTGALDLSDITMNGENMGALENELGTDAPDMPDIEALMDDAEIRLRLTFPGEVVDSNGEADGTTVTWEPVPGEVTEIEARAKDSGGASDGVPGWVWIVIMAAVVGLAAFLFLMSRARKGQPETAPAAADGVGDEPPPPPPGTDAGAAPAASTPPAEADGERESADADNAPPTKPTTASEPPPPSRDDDPR